MPMQYVLDAYLYFLVKEEKRALVRERIGQFLKNGKK